jgi:hypothetical protein
VRRPTRPVAPTTATRMLCAPSVSGSLRPIIAPLR